VRADQDVSLTLDPASPFWCDARFVTVEKGRFGKIVPRSRAMVRTRWTQKNIYFLFVSPYDELHLKPHPTAQKETNELWNWDVAEVFIGSASTTFSGTRNLKFLPRANGWISTSTFTIHTKKMVGRGTQALKEPLVSMRPSTPGLPRCAFRSPRSISGFLLRQHPPHQSLLESGRSGQSSRVGLAGSHEGNVSCS